MYHLKNWYISHYKGYLIAYGDVYNNPRFNQGHLIHTSKLDKIEEYQAKIKKIEEEEGKK